MTIERVGIFKTGTFGEAYQLCNDTHRWLWENTATRAMHDPTPQEPLTVTIRLAPSNDFNQAVTLSQEGAQQLWGKLHVGENLDQFQTFEL